MSTPIETGAQRRAKAAAREILDKEHEDNANELKCYEPRLLELLKRAFYRGREDAALNASPKVRLETLIRGHMEAMRPLLDEWERVKDTPPTS